MSRQDTAGRRVLNKVLLLLSWHVVLKKQRRFGGGYSDCRTLYARIWGHKQVQNGYIDTLERCTAALDDGFFRVPAIVLSQVIRSLAGFVDFFGAVVWF